MSTHMQVWFMPWAGVKSAFSLGPVQFWPWREEADNRVGDSRVRAHLGRLLESYVGHQGCPVDTVAVCSHGQTDFRVLDEAESSDVLRARDALFFSSFAKTAIGELCAGFPGMAPPTADVFALVTQNFTPGDDDISVRTRSRMAAGYKIGKLKFPKPFALGGGPNPPDQELIEGFDRAFSGKAPKRFLRTLCEALEWFRLAHIEEGEVSELSRIIMMATAFETLLGAHGKKELAREVDARIRHPYSATSWRKDKQKRTRVTYSRPACWIWDFYNLRSRVVHGAPVSSRTLLYRDRIMQINAAEMLFCQIVKLGLFKHECIGEHIRTSAKKLVEVCGTGTAEELADLLAKNDPVFNEVCRALGWAKPRKARPPDS